MPILATELIYSNLEQLLLLLRLASHDSTARLANVELEHAISTNLGASWESKAESFEEQEETKAMSGS